MLFTKQIYRLLLLVGSVSVLALSCKKDKELPAPATPELSTLIPNSGPVGTSVQLSGKNFSTTASQNIVQFNGTAATVTAATATQLTVAVPQGATTGAVSVKVGDKTATGPVFTVTVANSPSPTITSLAPTSGTVGTQVVITGTNFSTTAANNTVRFNGISATVTAATTTQLTVTVPQGATTGAVTVTVGSLTAAGPAFTVTVPSPTITSFTPTSGPVGTQVVITGTNFAATPANNNVWFNSTPATVTAATATQLTVAVPQGATTGAVRVTIGSLTATGPTFTVTVSGIGAVTTLAGSSSFGFADGTGSAARFNYPEGIAIDGSGNLYVADRGNHSIRKITSSGVVTTLAGSSSSGFADGTGTAAQFREPTGTAVDGSGNVYVADRGNHSIRKITPSGAVTTLAGSGTQGFADGTGIAAQFHSPTGIAVDGSGNVYVADRGNNRIRKITPSGVVTTLAGSTSGFADGTGTTAQFSAPAGIAIDGSGNLYVADQLNSLIRKITSSGVVTTLAGSGSSGFADGTGTAAQFREPTGIAVDGSGNVYVADQLNQRIRKITPSGVVTTLAGSNSFGFADGTGTAAIFDLPTGITIDGSGNLYVADQGNNRIRKITTR